jgi:hypothetical protein
VKLRAVWDEPEGGSPFAHITISTALFDKFTPRPRRDGADEHTARRRDRREHVQARQATVSGFADAKIQTREEFKTNFEAPINSS